MNGKYVAATYSIERNRFERYKNAADGDRMASYYYITVSVKRWRYLSESGSSSLPTVEECMEYADKAVYDNLVDSDYHFKETDLIDTIKFAQTPK